MTTITIKEPLDLLSKTEFDTWQELVDFCLDSLLNEDLPPLTVEEIAASEAALNHFKKHPTDYFDPLEKYGCS